MDIHTVGEKLYWCYANLAMAHAAVTEGAARYERLHYIIRGRLYAGFRRGTMNLGSIADDERLKMLLPQACAYCGGRGSLSVDHLVPKKNAAVRTPAKTSCGRVSLAIAPKGVSMPSSGSRGRIDFRRYFCSGAI